MLPEVLYFHVQLEHTSYLQWCDQEVTPHIPTYTFDWVYMLGYKDLLKGIWGRALTTNKEQSLEEHIFRKGSMYPPGSVPHSLAERQEPLA